MRRIAVTLLRIGVAVESLEPLTKGGAGDAKQLGGLHLIVRGQSHGPTGEILLDPGQQLTVATLALKSLEERRGCLLDREGIPRCSNNRGYSGRSRGLATHRNLSERKILREKDVAGRQHHGALKRVLELTDIAGPRVGLHDAD